MHSLSAVTVAIQPISQRNKGELCKLDEVIATHDSVVESDACQRHLLSSFSLFLFYFFSFISTHTHTRAKVEHIICGLVLCPVFFLATLATLSFFYDRVEM